MYCHMSKLTELNLLSTVLLSLISEWKINTDACVQSY